MRLTKLTVFALGFFLCTSAFGSPTGTSIGLNFSPDEPNGAAEAYVDGPAGFAGTANWNNLPFDDFFFEDADMDVNGTVVPTGVSVEWFSNNSWSTDGRGEDTNDAPDGNDRALMLGYLDTTDTSVTQVIVSDLPAEIASGFDVFVYVQGGVIGRGGTYTILNADDDPVGSQDNVVSTVFDGAYIEGAEGNYLRFDGLSGEGFTLEAMATTTALFRAPVNAVEICKTGECIPLPNAVAGRANIGDQGVSTSPQNQAFSDPSLGPGLAQEWFAQGNPGDKAAIDDIFDNNDPIVEPFRAGHGASWWTGSDPPFSDLVKYPVEIQPPFNGNNNDNYVTRLTGEILIPESGTYRFADGVDDYTFLAIDLDNSGVAGDDPDEVLIDDNTWTNTLRTGNTGGAGWWELDIEVPDGGDWLAIEFNQGEGGGGDSGVLYWDYDPNAPEGERLGGQEGFPELPEDGIDAVDAETMFVPDTHLRAVGRTMISAELAGIISGGWEFDVNGDDDTSDRFVLANPNDQVFTTIVDVSDLDIVMSILAGDVQEGDSFQIISADQIDGTPNVITDGWTFNPATGVITFGAGIEGDYNGDGVLDALDMDLQAAEMKKPAAEQDLAKFDHNGDGVINVGDAGPDSSKWGDRLIWLRTLRGSAVGDTNMDGVFDSGDLVDALIGAKYGSGEMALWIEGDWNGDMVFDSGDLVLAFQDGQYVAAATPAVPEPSAAILFVLGLIGLWHRRRSK